MAVLDITTIVDDIDHSATVLIFCTDGYVRAANFSIGHSSASELPHM